MKDRTESEQKNIFKQMHQKMITDFEEIKHLLNGVGRLTMYKCKKPEYLLDPI